MSLYEFLFLGDVPAEQFGTLSLRIAQGVQEFGLRIGNEVGIRTAKEELGRDVKASTVVAYFAGGRCLDAELAIRLLERGIPVIPVVQSDGTFTALPEKLQAPNGMKLLPNDTLDSLAAALLESAGLLRQQRRVFISYRRDESRDAALQLHDLLAARGFDAFLDTHSIRPGEPFQEVLWHRMTDSDVMIVLDTETYFDRRWTREEFGKAMAKEIHILRLVWPRHEPTEHLSIGEMVRLAETDLTTKKTLKEAVANDVMDKVERIRSRSIAARHRTLTGKLRAELERIGGRIDGVGARHAIAVKLSRGRRLTAYPAVGVPTAMLLNEIAVRATHQDTAGPILIYDHAGMHEKWVDHLDWLDANLSVVDAVKVFEAGLRLAELDE